MLTKEKQGLLQSLIDQTTKEELIWVNGYISGLIQESLTKAILKDNTEIASTKKLTIAYGTETGNSKKLASEFAAKAKELKIQTKLIGLDQYRLTDLVKEELFVTVISTQGEGEPPVAAQKFYNHIHQNGFQLQKMEYAVLALGDSSYPLYCKAGEDVDAQLFKLGANRIVDIQKCDVDYETEAASWFDALLKKINKNTTSPEQSLSKPLTASRPAGKTNLTGTILTHLNLNDRGSNKETWHIEIAAEALNYESGDSIGIVPKNQDSFVQAILDIVNIDADQILQFKNEPSSIKNLLKHKLNISNLNDKTVQRYAAIIKKEIPVRKYNLLELLKQFPLQTTDQFLELIPILNPQSPRLYTVSSSPLATEGEVHITVARDVYWVGEEKRYGLCSDYLSALKENDTVEFFVQKNKRFKLPAADKDVIMIGPGTGIAAFRGFLMEREAVGTTGKNWLFFGEQHFETDFLYQTEIQNWYANGTLSKVNVAFSRDQQQKIYVQDLMLKEGASIYEWIQNGAYIYICGKKDPMSVDVENTLVKIVQQFGGQSKEAAEQFINSLKDTHRFHKDVY